MKQHSSGMKLINFPFAEHKMIPLEAQLCPLKVNNEKNKIPTNHFSTREQWPIRSRSAVMCAVQSFSQVSRASLTIKDHQD